MNVGVIGGGVYGAATAYFLSRFGAESIEIFEKDHVASGSTGVSVGIVRHHYSHDIQIRMAKRGREIYENFEAYVGNDGGFRQNGYLTLAAPEGESELRRIVTLQRDLGIDVELLEPGELEDYLPGIDTDGVSLAAYEREGGFADPHLVASGFVDAAVDNGARIHTGTVVTDLEHEDGTVTGIETTAGTHDVDYVVNAAGPWGSDVASMIGVDLPLQWRESKVALLRASRAYSPSYPTLSDGSTEPGLYAKPEPNGEFLCGGIERPPIDRETGLEGVTESFLRQVSQRLEGRLPWCSDAEVVDTWSGVITVTPDAYQIVGVPEGVENFCNLVGGSGHGFKEAPAFAESVALDILGESPRIDLDPYALERFERGETFDGISAETYTDG